MKLHFKYFALLISALGLAAWPASAQQPPAPVADHAPSGVHLEAAPAEPRGAPALRKTTHLGLLVERISEELRYQLPLVKPGGGLIVREVVNAGPAAQAHIEPLDILLLWNDQILVHPAQLQVLVQSSKPGDKVTLQYLHKGALTTAQVTLAEIAEPSPHHRVNPHHQGAQHGMDLIQQALDALTQSDIDPTAIADALKHLDLGKMDPTPIRGSKLVILAADGTRKEIKLDDALNANGNLGEILKGLDLGKMDPVSLLSSKFLFIRPDGSQTEIIPADILKSSKAMGELLKGLGQQAEP